MFTLHTREREEKRKKRRSSEKGRGRRRKSDVVIDGKVKDGCFVVEKQSSDPYTDFTTSMVELIVEKHIFGARDLEDFLKTFLSVNCHHHHRVIVEVFTEICDALFPNWSLFS
ncbi:hypothetical protein RHSIM_Rhsim07G0092400 [Rhododendron simsii]|uniref:Transcription repressor n=1 Tax=Rhododendron simsii TaxID=118357 RepID=A0A834GL17_RHOSS|nr:hypothetical protein RHSIM_Rhsim07G0092400 [Rhododendron simsii]